MASIRQPASCQVQVQTPTRCAQAAANAKDKYGLEEKDLYVSECYADQAGYLKRAQPRAKGRSALLLASQLAHCGRSVAADQVLAVCRAYKILKPWSHLTIKVKQLPQDKSQDTTLAIPDAQNA